MRRDPVSFLAGRAMVQTVKGGAMSEMMVCEKMHARIPVATCAGRQTKGIVVDRQVLSPVYSIPDECRDCEAGCATLAGTPPKTKEESMKQPRKRPCANCGRVMCVVGDNCCCVCYHAGKGKEGEIKAAALAAVKEKIESGRLKRSGGSGRRKAAPAGTAKNTGDPIYLDPDHRGHLRQIPVGTPADIPVTIRLMVEISVRVASIGT
jgi:hypothetical protein